ncbi:MAG: DNA-binding domain-containing protein [Steroidobacteraceae bacterium]
MSTLAELQRALQQHVLVGDSRIVESIDATERVPAATRLAVYYGAYRSRLVDALAANVPRLRELIGESEFDELARSYIDEQPSRFASLRWFGDQLAAALARSRPSQPWLAELARWEWAIAAAFDSEDARPIDHSTLGSIAPGSWGELRLELHPSMERLQMCTNAPALFKALTEERTPPAPVSLEAPRQWLVWRRGLETQYRSLDAAEAAALGIMAAGGTFAQMCEILCEWHEESDVPVQSAGMLKRWIADELLIEVTSD